MRKICLRCGSKFGSRAEYCPHDGSLLVTDEDVADPLLGTVLLEQFHIDEQIGTGGMGTVYRARQTTVGRDVAIKVLRLELARDEQAVFRFEREARLAISLDHPNLVRVFLSGRLGDGRLYIVMELLEGRSLADELDERGLPSLERALIMIMKLCAGLGAVHAAGIVHRDIKPENVYLVRRGTDDDFVKLVDFGIARMLEGEGIGPVTTQRGRVFGTATYISPEAATGEATDQRSDIYSLGVLTYQLLTGELPFDGHTAGAVLMQHVHQQPPLLQTMGRGAEVPDDLAQVVMRALSKDPDARQQTLAEFLDCLAEAAGHAGLLNDARTLLLGTIWGDDLAAPGSYLAELLASSSPPSSPAALADTQPVPLGRAPDEEALLSSAPKPFGTTSHDLAAMPGPRHRKHGWLWASFALLALILVGVATGAWWVKRSRHATAKGATSEPVQAPPGLEEAEDTQTPDIGTDVPMLEAPVVEIPVVQAPMPQRATPKVARPKAKAKRRPKKKRAGAGAVPATGTATGTATGAGSATGAGTVTVPATGSATGAGAGTVPATGAGTVPQTGGGAVQGDDAGTQSDDGIDWTVPDFPEEPTAPTGTPDAPARNPIVIDEPPKQ